MKPAGFWRRVFGRIIDILVLAPVTATLLLVSGGSRDLSIVDDLFGIVLVYTYTVFCHARWGQTAGKMLLGTRVVTLEGQPIGFVRALLRSSVELGFSLVSTAFLILAKLSMSSTEFAGLDYLEKGKRLMEIAPAVNVVNFLSGMWILAATLVMATHPLKRALHDLIAGTRVVRVASGQVAGGVELGTGAEPGAEPGPAQGG